MKATIASDVKKHYCLNILGHVGVMYTDLHSLTQSLLVPSPGGIQVLNIVLYGEAPHGVTETHL